MQNAHGLDRLRTNLVLESERSDNLIILHDYEH
jgi:hypothetical protein